MVKVLRQASAVYTDAALTTLAADGYYSQGGIVRQQLNGVLLNATDCSDLLYCLVVVA
jgi:glucokinase